MIALAFGISFLAISFQYKYYIKDLEECLTSLEDEQSTAMVIANQQRRKQRMIIGTIISIIVGLALLLFLIMF